MPLALEGKAKTVVAPPSPSPGRGLLCRGKLSLQVKAVILAAPLWRKPALDIQLEVAPRLPWERGRADTITGNAMGVVLFSCL